MSRIFFLLCLGAMACNNHPGTPASTDLAKNNDSLLAIHSPVALAAVSADSAIAIIRHTFLQINALPLKGQVFKWSVVNCGEGTVTYYATLGKEIVKVVETGAIGDGSWTIAYYYQAGRFLFSLETNIGGPAIGPVDTFTVRKYAYGDKVVRTMSDDTYTTPLDSVLTPTSKEYRILEAYQTKNFGAALCQ